MDRGASQGSPIPLPRLKALGMDEYDNGDTDDSMYMSPKKKKKSTLMRLKDRKRDPALSNGVVDSEDNTSNSNIAGLGDRLDDMDISNLLPEDTVDFNTHQSHTSHVLDDADEPLTPTSSRKKKKQKGALSRLKDKHSLNDSLSSLRSQEMPDLQQIDAVDTSQPGNFINNVTDFMRESKSSTNVLNGSQSKLDAEVEDYTTSHTAKIASKEPKAKLSTVIGDSPTFQPVDMTFGAVDMNSAIESDEDDKNKIEQQYKQLLSTQESQNSNKGFPQPIKSGSTPQRVSTLKAESAMVKSDSMPNISDSLRSSKRNWQLIKSKIGIDGGIDESMRRSLSTTSINTVASGLHTVRISTARHKNFLVGQQNTHSSVMGTSELERTFPDRNVHVFVGTWNMADHKTLNQGVEDFVLPTTLEFVPDVLVITSQENNLDRKEWEVTLQETIGPNHVIFHSAQHGTLHMAVCMKRELIWFCSIVEEDTATVRAFKQFKTKGAVAISFTMFGTSFLFLGCHLTAHDNNAKVRVQDYLTINKTIRLPRAVVDNPLQTPPSEASKRFDCVFWAGDLNFRITNERDNVLKMIDAAKNGGHSHFEQLLENEELTQAINRGEIFEDFQEGQIRFAPTYKFDIGTDNYDTTTLRIPSYTDRILFRCKKKHTIVCLKYSSTPEITCSDHKPVYGLYQVNLKPGRDTIPLSGGQFLRAVYVEAAKRRALRRVADNIKPSATAKSSICSIS